MCADDVAHDTEEVATILEFFGIKLTTLHHEFAAVLKTDVRELLRADVKELFAKVRADMQRQAERKRGSEPPDPAPEIP